MFRGVRRRCDGTCCCSYLRPGPDQVQQGDAISTQLDGIAQVDVSPQQDGRRGLDLEAVSYTHLSIGLEIHTLYPKGLC